MLDVTSLVDSCTPLPSSTSVHVLLALGGKELKEREENFLFSVVEVTSPKKREKENSTSGVRLKFVAVTQAAVVTSVSEKHGLRTSLVSSTVPCVCFHRTEWIEEL